MRSPGGPIVVKLGGSHAFAPHLRQWLEAVASCAGRIVLVPGGKPFSDTVRAAQPRMGFDDRAAHRMALLAMEQFGCALASLDRRLTLADSASAIRRVLRAGEVPVWCPARMALRAQEVPWSWDVTSDSLAAWLAGRIGAGRVLLVKQGRLPVGPVRAEVLAAQGVVDLAFPRLMGAVQAYIVGPADHATVAAAINGGTMAGTRIVPN
jgi:5-(aminomethyl)-3-furanmethanol phosphate kinase